jgi:Zn-dependent protease
MHDDERFIQPRQTRQRGRGALGGILIALGVLAAKFKAILTLLLSFKWLVLGSKFLLSFSTIFLSVWFYALAFGGLKIAIVFVLMILVHELGHYVTWRNFGVPARLPFFIPGLGAFVSAPRTGSPAQNVAATLAGPLFGIAAAAACWAYGTSTHQHFWIAAAYIGFFLNFFNLMPIPILDGGTIAGAIDARLWFLGLPLFIAWMVVAHFSAFSLIFALLIAFYAVPRMLALLRGQIDPRGSGLTGSQRIATAIAYFVLALVAIGGAYATAHLPAAAAT